MSLSFIVCPSNPQTLSVFSFTEDDMNHNKKQAQVSWFLAVHEEWENFIPCLPFLEHRHASLADGHRELTAA